MKKNRNFLKRREDEEKEKEQKSILQEKGNLELLDLVGLKKVEQERYAENRFYGDRLRFLLNYYQVNQSLLARCIKVPAMYIAIWCTGEKIPTSQHIEKLCFFFEVQYNFFTDDFIQLDIFNGVIIQRDWKKPNESKAIQIVKDVINEEIEDTFEYIASSILDFLKLKEKRKKERYLIIGTSENVSISTVNKISKIPKNDIFYK